MNKCIKCGKFPFCKEAEENKKECDKFIKRSGKKYVEKDNINYNSNNRFYLCRYKARRK